MDKLNQIFFSCFMKSCYFTTYQWYNKEPLVPMQYNSGKQLTALVIQFKLYYRMYL
jgi:hypothetical protein